MKCPHCNEGIHDPGARTAQFSTNALRWSLFSHDCPQCKKPIVDLEANNLLPNGGIGSLQIAKFRAYPRNASARPVPADVTDPYRQDFQEAVAVLPLSAKASAALSRRSLQAILKDKGGATKKDLNDQIDEITGSGKVPSYIAESLHAVRNIGNFAAHPIKSTSTGDIVEVEPGEAEWNLDVLESLFDFYFVQPALTAKRKAELNKKLKDAGKPEIP